MYHYLFTNDLRISVLDESLSKAGKCFTTNTVPSATEDKSANNNMKTLGFYFNLTEDSNCAKVAAAGDVRTVVLNFIKKFQFPNLRTSAAYADSKSDGIILAPMRIIVKILYTMNLLSEGPAAHLSKEEIKYFVFYNDRVAKTKHPDIPMLINDIYEYRINNALPAYIDSNEENHEWKHEDRQIREMIKVLQWSGCVTEKEGLYFIDNNNLSQRNKADIFDIITCNTYWEGTTVESYREYMDIEVSEINNEISNNLEIDGDVDEYKRAAKVLKKFAETTESLTITELSDIEKARNEFLDRFSPDKLEGLSDEKLLEKVFYTQGNNTESLCYWIEKNKECKQYFGSISGGSAYKFGLFQKQENGKWFTGSPQKPQELSYDDAVNFGKKIVEALLKGAALISEATLDSLSDYEKLDDKLQAEISDEGVYYNWAWFHKYYSILFPDKLSSYHSEDWQKHVLWALRIKPSVKYYARSGQIAMVQKLGGWWYRQLGEIFFHKFGDIKEFLRLGSTDGSKGYASEWKRDSVVGIGWPGIGSLEDYKDEDGGLDKTKISLKMQEVYYPDDSSTSSRKAGELIRFYESNRKSIFVVADGERLIGLVDDIGEYYFDDSTDMANLKPGKWKISFNADEKLPNKSEGLMTSCVQIKKEENVMFLYEKYYYDAETNIEDDNALEEKNKMKNCLEIEREPRKDKTYPLNLIIYGAPGTGKTYGTAEYALKIVGTPLPDNRKDVMRAYNDLVRSEQIVFTTFHQSYGYEEFIQGLRPDTNSDKMSFKTVDGVFKRIADRALNDLENNYVIIIDEINRANISKVFGELITLIEEDKRWGEINETCATLQSGDVFAVPNNLYIIGTMNSADKSISLIDAALRRRFTFKEQRPNADLITDPKLRAFFEKLNDYLYDSLGSADLLVGHSYFMGKTTADLPNIMNDNIIPLLYEYFYDNKKNVNKAIEKCL
ncbi:MAG: AAA family ATPase [Treponema sp.]|nr:AAA family ATPase [Treponema sp.]